jgi:hypothetical protein
MVMIVMMHFDLCFVLFCGLMVDSNNAYFFALAVSCCGGKPIQIIRLLFTATPFIRLVTLNLKIVEFLLLVSVSFFISRSRFCYFI